MFVTAENIGYDYLNNLCAYLNERTDTNIFKLGKGYNTGLLLDCINKIKDMEITFNLNLDSLQIIKYIDVDAMEKDE